MPSREDSRRTLEALSLPRIALEIFNGRATHESLSYRCQAPHHSFIAPSSAVRHNVSPLWECGIDVTAYEEADARGRFVRFSLESPEQVTIIGYTFSAVVADLLVMLWEDEVSEANLREVAETFEFSHLDRLLADLADAPHRVTFDEHRQWLARTLSTYEKTA